MEEQKKITYIARNRKARHDYSISDTIEVGISLLGSEVKSLREGKINISDSYADIRNGEIFLKNLHISPYKMASQENHDPLRIRRLLLHKREIRKFKGKNVKIELALAVGRKKYDKRQAIAKADADRKMKSALKKDM